MSFFDDAEDESVFQSHDKEELDAEIFEKPSPSVEEYSLKDNSSTQSNPFESRQENEYTNHMKLATMDKPKDKLPSFPSFRPTASRNSTFKLASKYFSPSLSSKGSQPNPLMSKPTTPKCMEPIGSTAAPNFSDKHPQEFEKISYEEILKVANLGEENNCLERSAMEIDKIKTKIHSQEIKESAGMSTENLREIHDTNNFKLNKGQLSLEKVGITTLSLKQHFADLLESLADMEISLVQDTASLKATRILSNALMKLEKPNTERPATNKLHI